MARLIAQLVAQAGFVVDHERNAGDGLSAARRAAYDLVLLDRRLPDADGLGLLAPLRALHPGIRIMMLTALDSLSDTVSGLDAGADDYLTKPFRGAELISRIRACLRRPGAAAQPPLVVANLTFDLASREVNIEGRPVEMHRRELLLLEALMRRARRVVTREALLEEIYGRDGAVQQHTLDNLVWRLRRRLEMSEACVSIHLARGLGYILAEAKP